MFFLKTIRSCVPRFRWLFVGLAVLIALQPVTTITVDLTNDQQQQMLHFLQHMMQKSAGGQSQDSIAFAAVGVLPCVGTKSIIGRNEQSELQIDSLVRAIDKTETTVGRVVLKQTVCPTTDIELIHSRQLQVQALLDDHKLFDQVKRQLQRIKRAEHAVLRYWDESQYEHATKLFFKSGALYYTWISRLCGDWINQNRLSLELSHASEACSIVFKLIALIGLEGVKWEITKWMFGGKKKLNLGRAFAQGFSGAFNVFNPFPTELSDRHGRKKDGDSFQSSIQRGSWRDVWNAIYKNYDDKSEVYIGPIGWGVNKCSCVLPNCVKKKVDSDNYLHINNSSRDQIKLYEKAWWGGAATVAMPVVMAYRIKSLFDDVKATGQRIMNFTKTMKELHVHTVHVARAMDAMQKLAGIIREHSAFRTSCIAKHMQETVDSPSPDFLKLLDVLKKGTFTLKKAESPLYSRGNVLLAHRMFGKVKDEITPLLQAVGELDAVYSMASNIKEHQDSETPFALAEFVPDAQATMDLEDAWLPMINNSVSNTMKFGGDQHPNKLVITGPNGGGKSVFLKTLGCCVVLAQSWGIVPAKRARISLLDGVRTCIHPQESLEHELSTFMAEKMRIDAIKQYVFQNDTPGFKVLLLLDEPFKGTVDSESADRIYEFGKDIASLNGLIVAIATHVEKPIMLATDTRAYANYHVRIKELAGGRFEREFKLEPGILDWWFRDAKKRSQFIDFVTLEKHQEHMAQQEAKAKAQANA